MPSRFLIASLSFVALASGCSVYDPSLVNRDAGSTGACTGRRPPPRPTTPDDGVNGPEISFGLRDVVLDQEGGGLWRDTGFNLDGFCTLPPDLARECDPADGTNIQIDGNDGIDNTFGAELFPLVDATVMGLEDTARAAQLEGIGLPLLRIRNWNGQANDSRIEVTITQAVVTVPANADGSEPEITLNENFRAEYSDGTLAPMPNWDGEDFAFAREDTFLSGNPEQPLVRDDNAYVADDFVVVNLPDRIEILFAADNSGVVVRLTGGLAVGRLSADRLTMTDVVVGGRWSVVDLLRTAESIGVCMGTPEYNVLQARLNAIVDVRSEPGSGGTGVLCDAISIGVGFTGFQVQWGSLMTGRPVVSLCDMPPDAGPMSLDAGVDGGMTDAGMDAGFDAGP